MNRFQAFGKSFLGVIGLLTIGLLTGCGSSDGGNSAPGVVSVSLTDAPACGYDAVWVTVSKVRIHQTDTDNDNAAGWTDITLNPPRKINLLNLNDPTQPNFALDNLGEASLPAGHYTQVRLVLAPNPNGNGQPLANSVVLSGTTTEIELETPSSLRSGVKLIHQFEVGSGQRVDLLLDFDACKSIVQTGNGTYKLKPVIRIIPYVLNGIDGFIDTSLFADQTINNNVNHIVVTAQVNGEVVRATVPNSNSTPNPNRGKFFLARLDPNVTYDVVITADGHATTVITGVPVQNATSITHVSTSAVPTPVNAITLVPPTHSVSGTITFTTPPPPPTDDQVIFVAAQQQLDGGPLVTVKSRVATVLTNTAPPDDYGYSLTLPVDSPWVASGSTTLPLSTAAFTQQPVPPSPQSVAGKYTVQASTAGTTQSFNTDVSSADQLHNFVFP